MPRTFDDRYRPVLSMNDPGEPANSGAILVAPLGRGTYVYTTLSFFRQLPAGNAGAARLFANLIGTGSRDDGRATRAKAATGAPVARIISLAGVARPLVQALRARIPARCPACVVPLLSSLAVLAVVACSGDDRTVLTVYSPHGKELLDHYEGEFERANPTVDVQWVDMGSQEVLD